MQYALVTKNEGNHPFEIGREIEIWGGNWIDNEGNLTTPDGDIPKECFVIIEEKDSRYAKENFRGLG